MIAAATFVIGVCVGGVVFGFREWMRCTGGTWRGVR